MVKWKHVLIHCWLLFCSSDCSLYNKFHCPSKLEWLLRGQWFCTKYKNQHGEYSCLFNDITKDYDESCRFKAHPLDRGDEYVIKHRPTGVPCKDKGRYQPFGSQSFRNGCVNERSKCSESGQVIYHTGNSKVDTVCRCNFKKGYAFINTPKGGCSCTPSEEDCSCFLKKCQEDDELSADYKCVHKNDNIYFPSCPEMYYIEADNSSKDNKNHKQVIQNKETKDNDRHHVYYVFVIVGLTIIMVMFKVLCCALDTKGCFPSCCYIRIKSPRNLKVLQEKGKLKISWSKGGNEHSIETKYKVLFTDSDKWEVENTNSQTVDTGMLHCYLTSTWLPLKTYRFKVVAFANNIKSEACGEETLETGLPKKPQDVRVLKKGENISLLWAPPEESLFKIDRYKIEYSTDTLTNPPVYVSAESVKYVVKDSIGHDIYRFTISACSHGIEGEKAVGGHQNIATALVESKHVVPSLSIWS